MHAYSEFVYFVARIILRNNNLKDKNWLQL